MRKIDTIKQQIDRLDIIPDQAREEYAEHIALPWTTSVNNLIYNFVTARQAFSIIQGEVIPDKDLREHFRVRDFHRASHEVLAIVQHQEPMSDTHIARVHRTLMWNLDIAEAGEIDPRIHDLIDRVNQEDSYHPVDQAAILYGELWKSVTIAESAMMANLLVVLSPQG
ncbi:hypothetical protein ACFO25_13415 [Paenactinomyces guangxiensis]|uniref:Uncharacterized protein n=1 Tax=Paenactinomyces guangxiensis TaxID=1490290 RepID=A0A7W2A7S9_9BACL|nr:hypothetical protein [Paenactinomyces guangxiensis]MBA4493444.1 hypothetical protein [Paenactinomyces guangxiensis]MBH8590535.1 hypothetical protein [Paenactinomyces guangxiensis]